MKATRLRERGTITTKNTVADMMFTGDGSLISET